MIIAIDGPAGAGKSSVAKEIARRLKLTYVDTGAMYRALTWKALQTNTDMHNHDQMTELLSKSQIELVADPESNNLKIFIDETDVTESIRQPEVSNSVSIVASHKDVRKLMVEKQRNLSNRTKSLIMDGRDIGTVVFPQADLKIYLTASVDERAERRYKEQIIKGITTDIEELKVEIARRDKLDMNRKASPLKPASDSITVDTSDMTFEQVVEKITGLSCSKVKA